jgi:uncharacterized protein
VTLTLAATALLMGLAGGPHCAAMCGAACAGVARAGGAVGVRVVRAGGSLTSSWGAGARATAAFQFGRLTGYAAAGAAAAGAMQSVAWLAEHTAALRPAWTLLHLALLAWGLALLTLARQPAWVESAGRRAWSRVRPLVGRRGGVFTAGVLWAFMPCGLLYSALVVAALSGGPLDGAVSMALFAAGGALSLVAAPWMLTRLKQAGEQWKQGWGTRASGGVLALAAAWSLWADVAHRVAVWCGLG